MNKRPRTVAIISWIFIVFGIVALLIGLLPSVNISMAQRIAELKGHWYVHVSRMVMVLSGVLMLRGSNWGRWLLVAWLGFHVIVGALHSSVQLLTHSLFLALGLYLLFRPTASAYFRGTAWGSVD